MGSRRPGCRCCWLPPPRRSRCREWPTSMRGCPMGPGPGWSRCPHGAPSMARHAGGLCQLTRPRRSEAYHRAEMPVTGHPSPWHCQPVTIHAEPGCQGPECDCLIPRPATAPRQPATRRSMTSKGAGVLCLPLMVRRVAAAGQAGPKAVAGAARVMAAEARLPFTEGRDLVLVARQLVATGGGERAEAPVPRGRRGGLGAQQAVAAARQEPRTQVLPRTLTPQPISAVPPDWQHRQM